MAFDPTFGSFGDFLSIAALIKDIVIALDDSRGSKQKYQALIQELGILTQAIEQTEKIYKDQRYVSGVDRSPVTALETAVAKIWQRLEDFNLKLRKYAISLCPGGSGHVIRDIARKIQFKIEEKDVEEFQRDVLGYNISLKLLLQVTQMYAQTVNLLGRQMSWKPSFADLSEYLKAYNSTKSQRDHEAHF